MSSTKYTFQNINIVECVENSFEEFLKENQICDLCLTNKILEKWNFEDYLEKKNILPLNLDKESALISSIPNLKPKPNNSELKLVKFLGMIQNVYENQLYISAKFDGKNKKYLVNKYFENNNNVMKIEEDNAQGPRDSDILSDRLRLEVVPLRGLNEYFDKEYNHEEYNQQKIIVYDYSNQYTKVNQVILVIGVAYEKDGLIVIHSWKIVDNYEQIKICDDYKLFPNINEQKIELRDKLKKILLKVLKNDELAADYLLLFLFSQIFTKVGTKNVGTFPLNLILDTNNDINRCNDIYTNILNIFKKICLKIQDIKLTTDELNNNMYYPRFDSETEELCPGKLQLSDGTFLLIDEINMNEGKLVEIGLKNLASLKNLIDFQLLGYEYPYNKIEISHDIEILVVTHKSKSILYSPFLTLLPATTNNESNDADPLSENDFKFIFYYLNYIRYSSSYNDKFIINDEISNSIQKDYIANNPNFKADDFDLVLKLSRLYALSYGRNHMAYDDYEYVVYLEKQRQKRLENYKTKK